ncbi:MAG TPA: glycosyltransferase [Solirubrobacteraceae bacterium]|nr:glycosyltransferase [Solirubrobacteraceae bacterium]
MTELVATLERPLPAALPAGTATAVFCIGVCSHPRQRVADLRIAVDGTSHAPSAFRMPRPDQPVTDSGFWGTVAIPAHAADTTVSVGVQATLDDGATVTAPLAKIEIVAPGATTTAPATAGQIAVCMATFEPDPALFEAQLSSLRAQQDADWICVISDDCSAPERYAEIERAVGDDPRFVLSRSEVRLGFYRNFERALSLAPTGAGLLALCDQDDRWRPDKLATLRAALAGDPRAILAYSDMRLVEHDGTVLRDTLWRGRRNNYDSLASMLVANTITGAATLFRRSLLDLLLPFPDTPGYQFHDHWLGIAALAAGEIAYVDRPLYDYVQHPGAVFGDVTHGAPRHRERTPGRARAAYFHGYLARAAQAATVLARAGDRIDPRKRRALKRFIACDSSPAALAWLAARPARALAGRTETLASESELAYGVLWKQLATTARGTPLERLGPFADTSVPPPQRFTQKRLRRWRASI